MRAPRPFRKLAASLSLALVAALPAAAQPAPRGTVVLNDFTLIDGTGKAPVAHAAMVIADCRIAWVGPASELKAPADARIVPLTGKYVIPGLIDTHIHLSISKDGLSVDAADQTRDNINTQLAQFARYGVTAIQSMGTDQDIVLTMRDEQRKSEDPGTTRIFSAGLGVVVEGGYGGLAGVTRKVKTPAQATAAVATEVARKVDLIKFWLDDELGTMPKLPPEISAATIAAAHAAKLKVAAHIFYLKDAKRVASQGIDALAHSVRDKPVDAELIAEMKRSHTWQMAGTLARERALFVYAKPAPWLNDPFFLQSVTPGVLAQLADPARQAKIAAAPHFGRARRLLRTAQRNLKTLADAGIPYAMGTDAGGPMRFPGFVEHDELALMVESGLTPMQVIVASTSSGAKFLGAEDLGSLEKGKWADLVVLGADPLADIHNSRAIDAVYVAGRQVPSISR